MTRNDDAISTGSKKKLAAALSVSGLLCVALGLGIGLGYRSNQQRANEASVGPVENASEEAIAEATTASTAAAIMTVTTDGEPDIVDTADEIDDFYLPITDEQESTVEPAIEGSADDGTIVSVLLVTLY